MYVTQHVSNQMFMIREVNSLMTSLRLGCRGFESHSGHFIFPAFVLYILRRHVRVDLSNDEHFQLSSQCLEMWPDSLFCLIYYITNNNFTSQRVLHAIKHLTVYFLR